MKIYQGLILPLTMESNIRGSTFKFKKLKLPVKFGSELSEGNLNEDVNS